MIIRADARSLPLVDGCVDCCVTSPPYWGLRDYGHGDQIGLERTPAEYVAALVAVFEEVRRVLKPSGVLFLNLGDCYATGAGKVGECPGGGEQGARWKGDVVGGHRGSRGGSSKQPHTGANVGPLTQPNRMPLPGLKPKDLVGVPWAVAFALRDAGWYLRSDIIWSKPNPMPESTTDRPTKAHEYVFLLTKSERYAYDADAIAEPVSGAMLDQMEQGYDGLGLKDYEAAGVQNPSSVKARIIANAKRKAWKGSDFTSGKTGEMMTTRGHTQEREYQGKHRADDPQAAGRRMLKNMAEARAKGADHDAPFGLTRNRRTVWTIPTQPYKGAHFATMPEALVAPCILAGCPAGGLVLDPFLGSGTVGEVAERLGRRWVGTDLSYQPLSLERTAQRGLMFAEPA